MAGCSSWLLVAQFLFSQSPHSLHKEEIPLLVHVSVDLNSAATFLELRRMRASLSRCLFSLLGLLYLAGIFGSFAVFVHFMNSMAKPDNGTQYLNSCSKVLQCTNCYECELSPDQVRCCDGPCGESSICPTSVMSKAAYKRLKSARKNNWPSAVLSAVAFVVSLACVCYSMDYLEQLHKKFSVDERPRDFVKSVEMSEI